MVSSSLSEHLYVRMCLHRIKFLQGLLCLQGVFYFLLTEELKTTFDVGIEFNKLDYKPEYEDLENPTTETLVKRIEDAVRVLFFYDLETIF